MLSVLGWVLAGAVSLGATVLFVPRELWKRWRTRIVDRLDVALQRRVSRFDRRYREFLLSSLRFINLKGLATVGYYTPELDDVFVDVSLAYRAPHDVPQSLLAQLCLAFDGAAELLWSRNSSTYDYVYPRDIPACVTLLELRATGQAPIPETIILVSA